MPSSHTDGEMMIRKSLMETWLNIWVETKPDMTRSSSVENRRPETAYNTSGWIVVASTSQTTVNIKRLSAPCFTGTAERVDAMSTCRMFPYLPVTTMTCTVGNQISGTASGSLGAGHSKSC